MSSLSERTSGRQYWRSMEELAGSPEFRRFVEREFPNFGSERINNSTRRQFLKLMGASLALAGLAGCRWPRETIVPFAKKPGSRTPGVPEYYATAIELQGVGTGLLVKSYEGRPIKIEGNKVHPIGRGGSDAMMQATLLELYSPERSKTPMHRVDGQRQQRTMADFSSFAADHFAAVHARQGSGLCLLTEASSSPTLQRLRAALQKSFPNAQWFEYEALSRDNEREGALLAFGKAQRTHFDLSQADVIVTLDADLLMRHPAALGYTRDFAARRTAADGKMNRLFVIEPNYTVTGGCADERYAARPTEVALIAARLAAALEKAGVPLGEPAAALKSALGAAEDVSLSTPLVESMARDLAAARGRGVIAVGPRQPAVVHALAHVMNAALGNVGKTVLHYELDDQRQNHANAIAGLAEQLRGGTVDTLVIVGGNPAYDAPAELEFGQRLAQVKTSIHLSLHDDETSRLCTWHVPRAHYLESWGDTRAYDGTVSIVQPLIAPLYGGMTSAELLALLSGAKPAVGHDLVRGTVQEHFGTVPDFEARWQNALHDGVVPDSAFKPQPATVKSVDWADRLAGLVRDWKPADGGAFELAFEQDYKVFDGRFANNGWLQELPDAVSKLTWDNAAYLSPADAQGLGVRSGDMLRIELGGKSLEIAAMVQPGHARGAITLPLGYGREAAGLIARGAGFNVYPLRTRNAMYTASGAKVSRAAGRYTLAATQDHHAISSKVGTHEKAHRVQELLREGDLSRYRENPRFAKEMGHKLPLLTLWKEHEYNGLKWGMAIDLAKCTGCSACVVACTAENNVPVVGKPEVERGREMHWIRIDRYYKGEPDEPQLAVQPVTCHQCENAPCESVCPVAATVHDADGLNVMVYNRCVGTRYCNNNCPYKVRRFNWFYNHYGPYHPLSAEGTLTPGHPEHPALLREKDVDAIEQMVYNPEVTVRIRGVMEKCTFCTQRINAVKIQAKNERWEKIPDGLIAPACAQACPAEAIVFGDLNDKDSRVRALHENDRSYAMLEELNVKPRLHYLARLRNPAQASDRRSAPHQPDGSTEHPA